MDKLSSIFNLERIRAEKFRDFFILHEDGELLFHRAYIHSKIDDTLLSGFLSAIFSLSKELSIDRIQVMDMEESKFIYETRPPYIFIFNVEKDVDPNFAKVILTQIVEFFYSLAKNFKGNTKNIISKKLTSINFVQKLDDFINDALINDYFKFPIKILDELEAFLSNLFGTIGSDIVKKSIKKVCKRKENFKKDKLENVLSIIEDSLKTKISSSQVKSIINQIKNTFVFKSMNK